MDLDDKPAPIAQRVKSLFAGIAEGNVAGEGGVPFFLLPDFGILKSERRTRVRLDGLTTRYRMKKERQAIINAIETQNMSTQKRPSKKQPLRHVNRIEEDDGQGKIGHVNQKPHHP